MLNVQPINFDEACRFVARLHRHHRPPVGSKFAVACNNGEKVVGVLIAGRPVSRHLDDGITLEVTRCCTDGTTNACSILYGHAWKAAKALGFTRMVTYTLPEEGGASLRATGAVCVGEAGGGSWSNKQRTRSNDWPLETKHRWEWNQSRQIKRFHVASDDPVSPTLFDALVMTGEESVIDTA
jgi:hypothetical protein